MTGNTIALICLAVYLIVAIGMHIVPIFIQKRKDSKAIKEWGSTGRYNLCLVTTEELKKQIRKDFWRNAFPNYEEYLLVIIFWPILILTGIIVVFPCWTIYKIAKFVIKHSPSIFSVFHSLDKEIDNITAVKDIIQ